MTLSIWCKKTHEALLATYLFLSIFLLSSYMWRVAVWAGYIDIGPPGWLELANPFQLAFLPYSRGGESNLMPSCWFVLGALAFTVVLMTVAIYRLRAVTLRQMNQPARRPKRLWRLLNPANWLRWIPGPPLDLNPVLWREWHRNRPTGWTQVLWFVYAGAGVVFVGTAIYMRFSDKPMAQGMAAWINGMLVAVGLLLVSVSSVSSLAEERVRGSLDVLMTTPLSTPGIVFGKWLGSFRSIPLLAFLPTLLGTVLAMSTGRWFWVLAMVFLIVAQGAAVTSMGLATATWVARFGRAVAICVSAYVIMTVGWLFVVLIMFDHQFGEKLMIGTPFFGAGELTFEMGEISVRQQGNVFFAILWAIAFYVLAALLYVATLGTFDWCMGRITIRRHRGASLGEVKRRRVPIRTSARPNHSHSQPLLRIHATDESNKNL